MTLTLLSMMLINKNGYLVILVKQFLKIYFSKIKNKKYLQKEIIKYNSKIILKTVLSNILMSKKNK